MKKAPYSLAEAQQLCAEYQYLAGQSFSKTDDSIIECVTISPFDAASKERFLIFYFLFNSAESALAQEYKGLLYDVLVIARSVSDEHDLQQEELVTWLMLNKTSTDQGVKLAHEISGSTDKDI